MQEMPRCRGETRYVSAARIGRVSRVHGHISTGSRCAESARATRKGRLRERRAWIAPHFAHTWRGRNFHASWNSACDKQLLAITPLTYNKLLFQRRSFHAEEFFLSLFAPARRTRDSRDGLLRRVGIFSPSESRPRTLLRSTRETEIETERERSGSSERFSEKSFSKLDQCSSDPTIFWLTSCAGILFQNCNIFSVLSIFKWNRQNK